MYAWALLSKKTEDIQVSFSEIDEGIAGLNQRYVYTDCQKGVTQE